jgi:hypothetical protein
MDPAKDEASSSSLPPLTVEDAYLRNPGLLMTTDPAF